MPSRSFIFAMVLLLAVLTTMAPTAGASSAVSGQLSQQCVYAVQGGPAAVDNLTITSSSTAPMNVSLAVIGSVPQNTNVTVTPSTGKTPLVARIAIHATSTTPAGGYPLEVVAHYGAGLFQVGLTLHVVSSANAGGTACNPIGLPIPESTIVVTLTSLGLGLLTQSVTRRFVDLSAERRMKAEVNAFNKEKRDATAAKDKAKLDKLKKRELPMRQAQSKVQLARTKVTFITIVPLFLIYYLMASFLGGYGTIVSFSPIPIPYLVGANGEMVLIWWYIIGSFTFSSILSRLLHTTT